MRVVKEIPHHTFKITLFTTNAKYLIKIEWGSYEQTFKVAEMDLMGGTEDVEKMLTNEFLLRCLHRFKEMHQDFQEAFQKL